MGILQVSVTAQDLKKFGLDKSQISFEELFYDNDDIEKVYDVLIRLKIVNSKLHFICKTKPKL